VLVAASGGIGRAASIHRYHGGVSRFRVIDSRPLCQVSVMTRTSNRSSTTVRESVAALLLATKERYQGRRSKDVDRSER